MNREERRRFRRLQNPTHAAAYLAELMEGETVLPTAFTDPGCDAFTHAQEVMGACAAWHAGARWSQPQTMDCGCLLWVGPEAEERAGR